MRIRTFIGVVCALLFAACATAQQSVNVTATDDSTGQRAQIGSFSAKGVRAVIVNASGTSVFGTAGSAATPVLTVQGIASMTPLQVSQATGTNLHFVCDSGCSGSTAPADKATFTFGTTSHSPIGGVFQTTATNNALTNGQMGAWQFTAQRAGFINLRDAAGTEIGTSSTPVQVTGANGTFILGAGSATIGKLGANGGVVIGDVNVSNGSATATVGGVASIALVWNQYPTLQRGGTSAMTGTTSTQVIAAVSSNYLYIASCSVNNTHASVDTLVDLQDGSGGSVIWTFTAPHGYGGEAHVFNPPLKVPTLGNGLYAVDETTGASVKVFCQGFSSTTSY